MAASDPSDLASEPEFLFAGLAIDPPLVELERVFAKKLRSFESSDDPQRAEPYRRAYALGKKKLEALLGEEGQC